MNATALAQTTRPRILEPMRRHVSARRLPARQPGRPSRSVGPAASILAVLFSAGASPSQTDPPTADGPSAEQILQDLDSGNYQVQRRAVLAARRTRNEAILEKLLRLADQATHPNIRGYACETLGHYRDRRSFAVLQRAAAGPLSSRMGALPGLGLLRDARSYEVLVQALGDRSNWSYAATGLSNLGDPRGAAALAKVFREHLQDHAVHGGVAEAILALDPELAVDVFFAAMADERTYASHSLDRLLGQVKSDAVRDRARQLLDREAADLQVRGIRILGDVGDVRTVALLLKVMEQAAAGSKQRRAAIAALGRLGNELAVPQLARHLRSDNAEQRATVAVALGAIGHATATRPLVLALRQEAQTVAKLRIIEALGRIGDQRAVAALGERLADPSIQPQPAKISSIWRFPHNTPVSWAAWWSIQRIRKTGKDPGRIEDLFQFHGSGKHLSPDDLAAAAKWWREHRGQPGFDLAR